MDYLARAMEVKTPDGWRVLSRHEPYEQGDMFSSPVSQQFLPIPDIEIGKNDTFTKVIRKISPEK